jgi:hypothetical protein
MRSELASEVSLLEEMADPASWDEPARLSKFTEADRAAKTRQRGRRPPRAFVMRAAEAHPPLADSA